MRISKRLQSIRPSTTLAVATRAQALQRQGVDIVSFGIGEPDFDTPDHIKQAAGAALDSGQAGHYTPVGGVWELREAVAAELSAVHGVALSPSQVVVSNGAKHTLWNLLMALLDDGDEVIVPVPAWPSHIELVRMAGGVPRLLPGRAADGYQLDLAQLGRLLGPRTRAIILNSPSNPTGAVLDEATLRGVAELVRQQQNPELMVITDDLYRRLVYAPATWQSLLRVAPDLAAQVIPVDGVSKAYAMTGWRIGYCAVPVPLVEALLTLQGQVTTCAAMISQQAAIAALRGPQAPVDTMRGEFDQRRQLMYRRLLEIPGLRCSEPQGAFYCLPDVSAYLRPATAPSGAPRSDGELADWLLTEAGVATVPGSGFGAPGMLRLSYALSRAQLELGLSRLGSGLSRLGLA